MKRVLASLLSLLSMVMASNARADVYPSEPVRIVVPYAAGGIADVLARLVAVRFEVIFKQPFTVENRAGANGTIGLGAVAQAKPDGYTLLLGNTGTQVVNRFLYSNLPYDIEKAFQPVGLIASTPMLLVVSAQSPVNSVADLLKAARASPVPLNVASAGNGSASHLAMVMLSKLTRTTFNHVPYKGTSQIVPDMIGGRLFAYFDTPITAMPLIKAGKLKAIGVASIQSQPALPGVPTIAETVPGFETWSWLGLFAPAGVPKDRIDKLNVALRAVLDDPALRRQLIEQGNEVNPSSPQDFDAFIRKEAVRIEDLIKSAGIQLD